MKAIAYERTGDTDVLQQVERPEPQPGPGEVVVRVVVSGVNPTDWKSRQGSAPGKPLAFPWVVPNQDGAGTIVAVGEGVDPGRIGQRVWIWEAAFQRANGTAQELVAVPAAQAVPLPDDASFDVGASLGIPALTAHRCLTVLADRTERLGPGALKGRTVLVAGGAGAVGHAAIELAAWSDATVITTVSSADKEALAKAAGAHHIVNYRTTDAAERIHQLAPDGVDVIVEVAPVANAALDRAVLAGNGTIAIYANDGPEMSIEVRPSMMLNARYQFVMVYTVPPQAKQRAVEDVAAAVNAGVLRVGEDAGLPVHRFPLRATGDAHAAVEHNIVGKVLIDVDSGSR